MIDATLRSQAKQELARRLEKEKCRFYTPNGGIERWLMMLDRSIEPHPKGIKIVILRAGNGVGKTALAANLASYLNGNYPNKYFDRVRFLKEYRRPNRGRIMTTSNAAETAYDEELAKWLPGGLYEATRGGHKFNQVYRNKASGSIFDIFTFNRDPLQGESTTIDWAIIDEPMGRKHFSALKRGMRFGGVIFMVFTALEGAGWYKHAFETPERLGKDVFVMELSCEENCFPVGTQILTPNGWRNIESIQIGENVVGINDELESVIEPCQAVIRKKYIGEMVLYDGRLPMATPDHNMLVLSPDRGEGRRIKNMPHEFRKAEDLRRGIRMLGSFDSSISPSSTLAPFPGVGLNDWAEFLGWFISEGCVSGIKSGNKRGHYIYISQNPGPKRDSIRELLKRTPWKWRERRGELFTRSEELHKYLWPLGHSLTKRLPREVFGFPESAKKRLWKALLDGDGDGVKRYVTISEKLADDVQELLLSMGHRAHVRKWNTSQRVCNIHDKPYKMKDQYCVMLAKDRYYHLDKKEMVPFDGEVACIEVPSGKIVVRDPSEKYPVIVGNCKQHGVRGILDHETLESMWADYDENELPARRDGIYMSSSGLVWPTYVDSAWTNADGYIIGHVMKSLEGYYRECYDAGRFTMYCACDPHDRKPFALNWRLVFPNQDHIVVAEWPDESMKMFHKMKSCPWNIEKYAIMIRETEKAIAGRPADYRIMDPNFGNAPKATSKSSVSEEFIAAGKRADINWPLTFDTTVSDNIDEGHIAVKSALGDPRNGVRPKSFVMEHCRNTRFARANYAFKENKSESAGLSERPQYEFKDFADLDRLTEMFGLRFVQRIEKDSDEYRAAVEQRKKKYRPHRSPSGYVGMA